MKSIDNEQISANAQTCTLNVQVIKYHMWTCKTNVCAKINAMYDALAMNTHVTWPCQMTELPIKQY